MTQDDSKQILVKEQLNRLEAASLSGDLEGFRQAITDALIAKILHNLARTHSFRTNLETLVIDVQNYGDKEIVFAAAELGRLHSSLKAQRVWLGELITRLLANRIPKSFQYGDGDQRHHAAVALTISPHAINTNVIARAIVEEETAEKARGVWTRALLDSETLSGVFNHLADAMVILNQESKSKSGESRSRSLRRILNALNGQLTHVEVSIDEDLCLGMRKFITRAFAGVPRPQDYKVATPAVEELLFLAQQLIRIKFPLGADPALYKAVANASIWLPDGGWTRLARESKRLQNLRRKLVEGLVFLLERGSYDLELLEAHRDLSVNRKSSEMELIEVGKTARALQPELRDWLISGGKDKPTARSAELDDTDDLSIAMAMIIAHRIRNQTEFGLEDMLTDIRFRAPIHADTIERVVDLARELTERVNYLANRRRLRLFSTLGDVVEFSPYAHRLTDNAPPSRRVRIQSPGVEKCGHSASRVMVPALVETIT